MTLHAYFYFFHHSSPEWPDICIFSLHLLQLTQPNTCFWPTRPSHLRKDWHLLYIDIILSFVYMWEPKPIGWACQRRGSYWIAQKESIVSSEYMFLDSPGNKLLFSINFIEIPFLVPSLRNESKKQSPIQEWNTQGQKALQLARTSLLMMH